MPIFLLLIGLLATAAGFVMIGFGIPINAFSLGNTLILSGTIAVSTGLILIGMGAAISQLKRVVTALNTRPPVRASAARVAAPAEPAPSTPPPVVKVIPAAPPAPTQPDTRVMSERLTEAPAAPAPEPRTVEPPAPEPRVNQPPHPEERPAPGPLDWLRTRPRPAAPPAGTPPPVTAQAIAPELPAIEEELSPRPPPRRAPVVETPAEPKVWSPSRVQPATSRTAPRVEQPMPRATPAGEPPISRATPPPPSIDPSLAHAAPQLEPRNKDQFDLAWPNRGGAEPARREPEVPPPVAPRPREAAPVPPRPATAERGPAILKAGVIDGMPYTLYADGSIEAELSHGTVKFASVDALRAHLERQS